VQSITVAKVTTKCTKDTKWRDGAVFCVECEQGFLAHSRCPCGARNLLRLLLGDQLRAVSSEAPCVESWGVHREVPCGARDLLFLGSDCVVVHVPLVGVFVRTNGYEAGSEVALEMGAVVDFRWVQVDLLAVDGWERALLQVEG
jgi:hypothetical protein